MLLLLLMCSSPNQGMAQVDQQPEPTSPVLTLMSSLNDLADAFDLSQIQKNQMLWIVYQKLPNLIILGNEMMNNRMDLLSAYQGGETVSIQWVETLAGKQGELLRQIIIAKEQLKQALLSVLEPHQKELVNDLVDQLLLIRLGLFQK